MMAGLYSIALGTFLSLLIGPLPIMLHELGHLLGVKLAGLEAMVFEAGPLHISWQKNRTSWRIAPRRWFGSGHVTWHAPAGISPAKRIFIAAAGPAASLAYACVYFLAPTLSDADRLDGHGVAFNLVCVIHGLSSLAYFLLTAIPIHSYPFDRLKRSSDGYKILVEFRKLLHLDQH